ncbi:ATP-grasp domain-containing protein [Photobacterium leiognathi]|uniref:ATP-grasp domain-containing protein n=1 Tax=Photobacterium leiognathi TaxID=553611 RepID=UPI0027388179|nr:ATP-grasp domain-containing protein [Photobacterium leiognathi]
MYKKKDCFIIVDGYGTGAHYAKYLSSIGIESLHVESFAASEGVLSSYCEGDYIDNVTWDGDIDEVLEKLKGRNVLCVLPGKDHAVELSDIISHQLNLSYSNIFELSKARRNKFEMQEALRKAGVRSIVQFKSDNLDSILSWIDKDNNNYPYIIKPLESASSDGVRICHNQEEIKHAFDNIYLNKDVYGNTNKEVLAQYYLDSDEIEYCVNTVSLNGQHFVSEIIRVYRVRIDNSPVHDYNELLCPIEDSEIFNLLANYIYECLDALGIQNGAGHSEVMITSEGPTLLETGARMPGRIDLSAYTKAMGHNQLSVLFESILDPETFRERVNKGRRKLKTNSSCVFFISDRQGAVVNPFPADELVENYTHFHSFYWGAGNKIEKTIDFTNTPGQIFLIGDDKNNIKAERLKFREREDSYYLSMILTDEHVREELIH